MNAFGLGQRTGVDLTSELPGLIPDTSRYNTVYRGSWNSCTNLTLGIGQDMMQSTPLQLANAICIIANKGYYYTPHFVQQIDGQTANDTILNKFKAKHEVLTQISDEAYEAVHSGMQQVIEGTSSRAKVPGITICGKTGTAEKYRIIQGKRIKLENNSVFVCFAPRENPRIALAVVVENSGFGNTWAAPIAGLMLEKYLKDSLPAERLKEVDRIAHSSLMPSYIPYLQYIEDSARASNWLQRYRDSSAIKSSSGNGRDLLFPGLKNRNLPCGIHLALLYPIPDYSLKTLPHKLV
ncbi:penicillin-binding transpeptidase domain-containing protein [Paraflavitalea speifideaquila]|uniref:penicillin-binding transpeptidase domain-containing protein n=1 Tax=Paraflavitalea speifideaquila TaxID=3076558 RepID=UPI0028E83B27|nr:penicillin-binding transpeptidase domain-containing protein [Paraflavitalea speifideiaquila]